MSVSVNKKISVEIHIEAFVCLVYNFTEAYDEKGELYEALKWLLKKLDDKTYMKVYNLRKFIDNNIWLYEDIEECESADFLDKIYKYERKKYKELISDIEKYIQEKTYGKKENPTIKKNLNILYSRGIFI